VAATGRGTRSAVLPRRRPGLCPAWGRCWVQPQGRGVGSASVSVWAGSYEHLQLLRSNAVAGSETVERCGQVLRVCEGPYGNLQTLRQRSAPGLGRGEPLAGHACSKSLQSEAALSSAAARGHGHPLGHLLAPPSALRSCLPVRDALVVAMQNPFHTYRGAVPACRIPYSWFGFRRPPSSVFPCGAC